MPTKPATTKPTDKPFKIPKQLAECADLLYTVRTERLALEKLAEAKQKQESLLREHLINNLPKSKASGISGTLVRASIGTHQVVTITDWDAYWAYIVKQYPKNKGVTALLQRRAGDGAVKEMWNAGKKVPGATPLDVPFVSLNKL